MLSFYTNKKVLDWAFRHGNFNEQAMSVLNKDTREPTTSTPTSSEAENSTGHCHCSAKGSAADSRVASAEKLARSGFLRMLG
jgi:hypothetical protein